MPAPGAALARRLFPDRTGLVIELPLQIVQHPDSTAAPGRTQSHRLAALADRGEELAVLQFDAVHRDVDFGHVALVTAIVVVLWALKIFYGA